MNSFYPKRVINFLSFCLWIVALMAGTRALFGFLSDMHNFTYVDMISRLITLLFIVFVLLSIAMVIWKNTWAWIGITSYLLYSLFIFTIDFYYGGFQYSLQTIILVLLVIIGALVFAFKKPVLRYFNVTSIYLLVTVFLSMAMCYIANIDPLDEGYEVNSIYLDYEKDMFHLDGERFTGKVFENHKNGTLSYIGDVQNGAEQGEWKYYFENGNVQLVTNFKEGLSHGESQLYYEDGNIQMLNYYHEGLKEGKETIFYNSGEIDVISNYKKGILDGQYKSWFSSGQVEIVGTYSAGKKEGKWSMYDFNSPIAKVELYKMDTLEKVYYTE